MHIFNKVRWRVEKYILDPVVNFYLKNRIYEKNNTDGTLLYTTDPELKVLLNAKRIFQNMITSNDMSMLYEKDFDDAYSRGIQNDPINIKQKEIIRYRVYVNSVIARLASRGGGDFCTVGVSYGIVPRTIYNYLNKDGFWKNNRSYFLIDKWEKIYYASEGNAIKEEFCGDIHFIRNEFKEENFKIIQKYAPEAFDGLKNKISYLQLNCQDTFSETKTIELLYDQITTPGFIVIDRYIHSNEKHTIDSFLKKKNNFVFPLANSQGIIIKL